MAHVLSVATIIGVQTREICFKLIARVKVDLTQCGRISQEDWDEMAEDVEVLKNILKEAQKEIQQIFSSLDRQILDKKK